MLSRFWWRRTAELATGISVLSLTNFLFDYILYPLVIYWLGLLVGGIVMAGLSFLTCWLMLWFYDRSARDWLGIEAAKQVRDYAGHSRWRRGLAWSLQRGDVVACVALSIYFDPFITTAYLRRGSFNGMNRRDWRIFWASWFIGNLYWTFACFGGVKALQWAWRGWFAF